MSQNLVDKIQRHQFLHDFVSLDGMLCQTSVLNHGVTMFLLSMQLLCPSAILKAFSTACPPQDAETRATCSPRDMHQGVVNGPNDVLCFVIISLADGDPISLAVLANTAH